jgi:YD repeat-containing protein
MCDVNIATGEVTQFELILRCVGTALSKSSSTTGTARQRLVAMTDSSAGTYEYSYDARDLVVEIRMPNGCSQHFTSDQRYRIVSRRVMWPDGSEICAREFSYDAVGRLSSYLDSLRRYEDNVTGLRASVSNNGHLVRFAHDANGNLLMTRSGVPITYAARDRAMRVSSDELDHDARGNLIAWRSNEGESRFEYTGEGQSQLAIRPTRILQADRLERSSDPEHQHV